VDKHKKAQKVRTCPAAAGKNVSHFYNQSVSFFKHTIHGFAPCAVQQRWIFLDEHKHDPYKKV
jgi:hypothetical protein